MPITVFLNEFLWLILWLLYWVFPVLLYYKLKISHKSIYITIVFFIVLTICNYFLMDTNGDVIVIFYDYFFWLDPFELNFTNKQVFTILWSFFIPFFIEYIFIIYYTNKKYLLYYFIVHFVLLFSTISYFIYQIIIDKPWFINLWS